MAEAGAVAGRVVVELPDGEVGSGDAVLAAALTLFGQHAEIGLYVATVQEPDQALGDRVLRACTQVVPEGFALPDIVLLGRDEVFEQPHLLHVSAGGDAFDRARAVVLLAALAEALSPEPDGDPSPAPDAGAALRSDVSRRIAQRDSRRVGTGDLLVVAVVQVQSTWLALESICAALAAHDGVRLEVVALPSEHELAANDTSHFVTAQGYLAHDLAWFERQLADEAGDLALVLLDNPWDALRPEALRSANLADAGVRIAYSPYGNNVGAGDDILQMQYNLQLHWVAWRIYARSSAQLGMFRRHCSVGNDHVRVLGMPKLDRITALRPLPADHPLVVQAAGRPVVLWNPHFSFGPEGWSTFDRYVGPLLSWFDAHPDVVLLVRPHFRLFRDMRRDADGRRLEQVVRDHVARADNVLLDDSEDYLPAFAVSDALVSDLSSLITEYLPTASRSCTCTGTTGPA